MKSRNIMPTTWLLVALVLQVVLHFVVPWMRLIPSLWKLIGLIPMALGVWINLVADKAFHVRKTTVKPFEASTALVTDKAFGITRNPMYVGFTLILLGVALLLGSLTPLIVMVGFAVLMDRTYIREEERMMAADFGERWEAYADKTRRWL